MKLRVVNSISTFRLVLQVALTVDEYYNSIIYGVLLNYIALFLHIS